MTQDEIIEMARQAGLWETRHSVEMAIGGESELEAFAKLVAAKEREACAKTAEKYQDPFCGQAVADEIRARGQ